MSRINNITDLKIAILKLEEKQELELLMLKKQISDSIDNINPLDILKKVIKNISSNGELNENIFANSIGFALRYFSRLVLIGNSKNPFKNFLVNILQIGFSTIASQNPAITNLITKFLLNLISKKPEQKIDNEHAS